MQNKKHKALIILTFFSGWLCFTFPFKSTGKSPRFPILKHQRAFDEKNKTEATTFACTINYNNQQQTPAQKNLSELQDVLTRALPVESCEILPTKHNLKDGTLTDYWAQEMVGADLLREEIEKAMSLPEDKFLIAVFDNNKEYNNHAVYVENIISHKGPQAILPSLNSLQLHHFPTNSLSYMETVNQLKTIPSFINNSMYWNNSERIYTAMAQISPPAILITASGNDYLNNHHIDSMKSKFSKDFDGIIVGSLSPQGHVSDFSQEGEEVHILAPSDHYLTSIDNDGNYAKFGGSSGAAPLVTGTLAGFEWLTGYHPTAQEAKLLLENTAVPTVHSVFENPQKNGVGMLNAYKLGQVAKRLKDKCNNDNNCFKQEIQNPENYQFSIDQSVLEETQKFFPKCSNSRQTFNLHSSVSARCTEKKSALKNLRKAVLLDTTNVELWEQLHCIYKSEGFSENALGVERTLFAITKNKDFLNDIEVLWSLWSEKSRLFSLVNRNQKVKFFNELLDNNPSEKTRINIAIEAGKIGGNEGFKLLEQLIGDSSAWVREEVAWNAGQIGGNKGRILLEQLAEDSSEEVVQTANKAIEKLKQTSKEKL